MTPVERHAQKNVEALQAIRDALYTHIRQHNTGGGIIDRFTPTFIEELDEALSELTRDDAENVPEQPEPDESWPPYGTEGGAL